MKKVGIISKTSSRVLCVGIVSLILIALVGYIARRDKREQFVDKMEIYKSGMQTMRKCKRHATRFAKNNIESLQSKTKRYIRKSRL